MTKHLNSKLDPIRNFHQYSSSYQASFTKQSQTDQFTHSHFSTPQCFTKNHTEKYPKYLSNCCWQSIGHSINNRFNCKMKKQELFAESKPIILQIQKNTIKILKKIKNFTPIYKTFELQNVKIKHNQNQNKNKCFKLKNKWTKKYFKITFYKQEEYLQACQLLKFTQYIPKQIINNKQKQLTALTAEQSEISEIVSNSQDMSSQLQYRTQLVNEFLLQQPSQILLKQANEPQLTDYIFQELQYNKNQFTKKSILLSKNYQTDFVIKILNEQSKWNPTVDKIQAVSKIDDNCFIFQKKVQQGWAFNTIRFIRKIIYYDDYAYIYDTTNGIDQQQGQYNKILSIFFKQKQPYCRILQLNCKQKTLTCYQKSQEQLQIFECIESILNLLSINERSSISDKTWTLNKV